MKIYLCLVGIFSVLVFVKCNSAEKKQEIEQLSVECEKEMGVTRESVRGQDKFDCLIACVMRKRGGIMDGKAVAEKITEIVAQDLREEATDTVKTETTGCVNEANKNENECKVFVGLRDCLAKKRLFR